MNTLVGTDQEQQHRCEGEHGVLQHWCHGGLHPCRLDQVQLTLYALRREGGSIGAKEQKSPMSLKPGGSSSMSPRPGAVNSIRPEKGGGGGAALVQKNPMLSVSGGVFIHVASTRYSELYTP